MIINKKNAISYDWGNECKGWFFHDSHSLSIIVEKIPADQQEPWHYHQFKEQFFYITKGQLTVYNEEQRYVISANEGVGIKAGQKHRVVNEGKNEVEFILISNSSDCSDKVVL